jgi:hypothetical protein
MCLLNRPTTSTSLLFLKVRQLLHPTLQLNSNCAISRTIQINQKNRLPLYTVTITHRKGEETKSLDNDATTSL